MRIPPIPHPWNVTPQEAVRIQHDLAAKVQRTKPNKKVRFVAGVDSAFSKDEKTCIAGVTVWDLKEAKAVEQRVAKQKVVFPYIPGFLSFREAPAVLAALKKLRHKPDVLMCDGQGLAHPRRFGIACHVGLLLKLPSIGCAKSRLTGKHETPDYKRGSAAPLVDKGELIGTVLRTQDGINPLFVSIGHLMGLKTAEGLVLQCSTRYRLPEPTRLSDQLVSKARREMPRL